MLYTNENDKVKFLKQDLYFYNMIGLVMKNLRYSKNVFSKLYVDFRTFYMIDISTCIIFLLNKFITSSIIFISLIELLQHQWIAIFYIAIINN